VGTPLIRRQQQQRQQGTTTHFTLAARRLEELFPFVLLCQFFGFWKEIGFGVTYLRI
jgi:hypothetical protein